MTQQGRFVAMLCQQGIVDGHEILFRHGITRAAAIVHRLRQQGWPIDTVDNGPGKLASYRLRRPEPRP